IGQVREALTARFTVDAFPERTFVGTVSQVRKAATVTNNVVTYKVIIDADNPRQQLLPGMTANVNIVLGEKDDVLRVSNSALRFTPPGVERQDEGGFQSNLDDRLERLTAELGLDSTQRRAVESALRGMEEAMAEIRAGSQGSRFAGPGGFGAQRERIRQMRQSTQNQLAGVLSPEQLAAFEQRFAGRGGGARDSGANMRPGQVWVVDNGEPKRIRVLTGLSDDQFTEIVSDELSDGDEVIVRLAR
ncbi:MAG: efflux RND transporter periplasmic adaptor subunit, partial [Gammaproteobacteria bacterium]